MSTVRSVWSIHGVISALRGRHRTAVEHAGVGLCVVAPDGLIVLANRAAEAVAGYPHGGLVGRRMSAIVASARGARADGAFEARVSRLDGATAAVTATRDEASDGSSVWTLCRCRAVREEDGATDLASAVLERDRFISLAAHELKTPLAAVRMELAGVARTLQRSPAEGDTRGDALAALARFDREVDGLVRFVNNLLDTSKIGDGSFELSLADVDLSVVASDVVRRCADVAAASGSPVRLTAQSVVGRWDGARLEQVATNLLTNAIQYGAGAPIDVSVSSDGDRAFLTVVDRGIGIAPEHHGRVFGRFERVRAPGKPDRGLGLGLWISRKIVELHGGSIRLESELGRGSTFVVELPIA